MRGAESAGVAAVRAAGFEWSPSWQTRPPTTAKSWAISSRIAARRRWSSTCATGLSRAAIDAFRQRRVRIVSIDDASDRRLAADLAFYPPVPQVENLTWPGFTGRRYVGWEVGAAETRILNRHIHLPRAERLVARHRRPGDDGRSDPAGMTEFAVGALELLPMPLAVHVVVGPAFSRAEPLIDAVVRSKHSVQMARAPASLAAADAREPHGGGLVRRQCIRAGGMRRSGGPRVPDRRSRALVRRVRSGGRGDHGGVFAR